MPSEKSADSQSLKQAPFLARRRRILSKSKPRHSGLNKHMPVMDFPDTRSPVTTRYRSSSTSSSSSSSSSSSASSQSSNHQTSIQRPNDTAEAASNDSKVPSTIKHSVKSTKEFRELLPPEAFFDMKSIYREKVLEVLLSAEEDVNQSLRRLDAICQALNDDDILREQAYDQVIKERDILLSQINQLNKFLLEMKRTKETLLTKETENAELRKQCESQEERRKAMRLNECQQEGLIRALQNQREIDEQRITKMSKNVDQLKDRNETLETDVAESSKLVEKLEKDLQNDQEDFNILGTWLKYALNVIDTLQTSLADQTAQALRSTQPYSGILLPSDMMWKSPDQAKKDVRLSRLHQYETMEEILCADESLWGHRASNSPDYDHEGSDSDILNAITAVRGDEVLTNRHSSVGGLPPYAPEAQPLDDQSPSLINAPDQSERRKTEHASPKASGASDTYSHSDGQKNTVAEPTRIRDYLQPSKYARKSRDSTSIPLFRRFSQTAARISPPFIGQDSIVPVSNRSSASSHTVMGDVVPVAREDTLNMVHDSPIRISPHADSDDDLHQRQSLDNSILISLQPDSDSESSSNASEIGEIRKSPATSASSTSGSPRPIRWSQFGSQHVVSGNSRASSSTLSGEPIERSMNEDPFLSSRDVTEGAGLTKPTSTNTRNTKPKRHVEFIGHRAPTPFRPISINQSWNESSSDPEHDHLSARVIDTVEDNNDRRIYQGRVSVLQGHIPRGSTPENVDTEANSQSQQPLQRHTSYVRSRHQSGTPSPTSIQTSDVCCQHNPNRVQVNSLASKPANSSEVNTDPKLPPPTFHVSTSISDVKGKRPAENPTFDSEKPKLSQTHGGQISNLHAKRCDASHSETKPSISLLGIAGGNVNHIREHLGISVSAGRGASAQTLPHDYGHISNDGGSDVLVVRTEQLGRVARSELDKWGSRYVFPKSSLPTTNTPPVPILRTSPCSQHAQQEIPTEISQHTPSVTFSIPEKRGSSKAIEVHASTSASSSSPSPRETSVGHPSQLLSSTSTDTNRRKEKEATARTKCSVTTARRRSSNLRSTFAWLFSTIQVLLLKLYPSNLLHCIYSNSATILDTMLEIPYDEIPETLGSMVRSLIDLILAFGKDFRRRAAWWQYIGLLIAAICLVLGLLLPSDEHDWYKANTTSTMRDKVINWKECYWGSRMLDCFRLWVQRAVEGQQNDGNEFIST